MTPTLTVKSRRAAKRYVVKAALLVGALSCSHALMARRAFGENLPLFWGSTVPGAGLGPVLTGATIVPVFWGNWAPWSGAANDPVPVQNYLDSFTRWIGGEGSFDGQEPVLRQYGIWGAQMTSAYYFYAPPSAVGPTGVQDAIHQWQAQGQLPQNGTTTIFLVMLYGFTSYGWETSTTCANHTVSDGTYYAQVSLDGCNGSDISNFQHAISHELEETMTDPQQQIGSFGWITHEGTLGFHDNEGADQCETAPDLPHPYDIPLSFGIVQNFTDNSYRYQGPHPTPGDGSRPGAMCNTFTPSRQPMFGVTRRSNTQLDVVYQDFNHGGALEHVDFLPDYTWVWETIDSGPGIIVGAPSLVSAVDGQLDVFVRTLGGAPGPAYPPALVHYSKAASQSFSEPSRLTDGFADPGVGPPSAVSWGQNRIDVFSSGMDTSLMHFWSDDTVNYASERFGVFMMGPPVAVSRGYGMLDVLAYDAAGFLQAVSYNNPWDSGWTLQGLDVTGIYFSSPADRISAAPWGSSLQTFVSGIMLNFGTSSPTWNRQLEFSFGSTPASGPENKGSVSVASSQDGSESIAVWQADLQSLRVVRWTASGQSPLQYIVGGQQTLFMNAPTVIYGSDGYPEVLAVGLDGCLWETWLDYWSGGPIVNGPNNSGICGFILDLNGNPKTSY